MTKSSIQRKMARKVLQASKFPKFMDHVRQKWADSRLEKVMNAQGLTYDQYMSSIECPDDKLPAVEGTWSKKRSKNAKKTKKHG